jgi:hypothetical protein
MHCQQVSGNISSPAHVPAAVPPLAAFPAITTSGIRLVMINVLRYRLTCQASDEVAAGIMLHLDVDLCHDLIAHRATL